MTPPDASVPRRLTLTRRATPVGEALIVVDEAGVLRAIDFADYEPRMRRLMGRHYPGLEPADGSAPSAVVEALSAYFEGELSAIVDLPAATNGTVFQRTVWAALRTIPAGTTVSYGELAVRIGHARAVRAVGLANGANPIAIVAPCHRVVGASGDLTGYAGGLARKRWLLRHEGVALADKGDPPGG